MRSLSGKITAMVMVAAMTIGGFVLIGMTLTVGG